MTNEENKRRQQDEHVQYIKNHLCDKDSKKPFVFISYKSDDWEIVLHEVVYTLVKDYGLNVYFDGSFDSHNSLWINQFPQNMSSGYCKGVLAFLDNRYATSYATLMELLYSQTLLAGLGGKYSEEKGLPVIPINLDKLTKLESEVGEEDTGLGVSFYPDGTENTNAKAEEHVFISAFEELKERKVLGKTRFMYHPGGQLKKSLCRAMLSDLLAYLQVNENWYKPGQSLDGIVGSIKDACGDKVFSAPSGPVKPPKPPTPPEIPAMEKCISLPAFIKKYNNNTFKKEMFQQVRLVGQGEYAVYSTPFLDSAYPLAWSFVEDRLKEQGEQYIRFVNERSAGSKNPPFITAAEHQERKEQKHPVTYRNLELPGLEGWAMCRHYGQYAWINDVLRRRMLELGLPLENFSLEFIPNGEAKPAEGASEAVEGTAETENSQQKQTVTETVQPDNRITGPVPLSMNAPPGGGKKTSKMKLPEMVAAGKVCAGDIVYVKRHPEQKGTITAAGEIAYGGQDLSLNQYVKAVLGDGSYNAYICVYHEKTGKLLDELR